MGRPDESTYLGAYWGDRPESAVDAAGRLHGCLRAMSSQSAFLDGWRRKGRSRATASSRLATDVAELARQLELSRGDDGQERRAPGLGYRWSAWNGDRDAAVSISVTCGATASDSGVVNAFVVSLSRADARLREVYERGGEVLRAVVEAWEPDWAVWTSHALRTEQGCSGTSPMPGWLTYVGDTAAELDIGDPLGSGRLIRAAEEWGLVDAARLAEVRDRLVEAGAVHRP